MKIVRSDLRLVIGMICGIGIFITGLLGLVDVLNMRIVNNIMIFVAGVLQLIIGVDFATKNKKVESKVFYGISIIIFGMFILSIIK